MQSSSENDNWVAGKEAGNSVTKLIKQSTCHKGQWCPKKRRFSNTLTVLSLESDRSQGELDFDVVGAGW
jgi:purine nucleoside permease